LEVFMRKTANIALLLLLLCSIAFPQSKSQEKPQKPDDDQPIRISTELVQLDVVVVDKKGAVVKGLKKEDFELSESGKKQPISFFEFVEAGKGRGKIDISGRPVTPTSPQGATEADIGRIFAFIVDDLTIRPDDLVYVRKMLTNFVNNRMQPTDLVAIVRTIGGKGLLQQFTTDKQLLMRSIDSLNVVTHPLNSFNKDAAIETRLTGALPPALGGVGDPNSAQTETGVLGFTDSYDPLQARANPGEDTNKMMRAYMSLGTASFVIDSMRQLPGRKSLVLISGGLPILDQQAGTASVNVSQFINVLSDRASRAGVAIHTLDIQGLSGQVGVARYTDTPGKSMIGGLGDSADPGLGRRPDEDMLGSSTIETQMGLRRLAADTGGIAILNRNNFDEGLGKILDANEGYYLLAYTPQDTKFDGKFRRVEIKVKGEGMKVYSRRGYFAREDKAPVAAASKQDQILVAIHSPLTRADVDIDSMLLYKAMPPDKGVIDIHLVIDAKKLQFEQAGDKQQASLDIAGFVFDEMGQLRGGFSETISANLTPQEFDRINKGGFLYTANTTLPAGVYQVRFAVRDNKTGRIGTMSRYIEVPDLSKGRFFASSLLLGAVPPNDTKATTPAPVVADRQVSRTNDLRYATVIYNAKQKDGKPQIKTQLMISQNGKVIFKEPEELLNATGNATQMIKIGQLGLSRVPMGRYTLTLVITDMLADKKTQPIIRTMDFIVIQ
jgi:VWFA-related protein